MLAPGTLIGREAERVERGTFGAAARYWAAMSKENVDIVRHWIDAGNRADLDGWLSCFAPRGGLAYERPVRGSGCVSRA
jgi:hypothetical protein